MRCPTQLEIQSHVDGELDAKRTARIAGHLVYCRSCQSLARDLTTMATLLHTLADIPPAAPGRLFAPRTVAEHHRKRLPRWVLVPAAACLLVALSVTWRYVLPRQSKTTYISAFVEAHRTQPVGKDLPEPCDFGLGGQWE